MKSKNYLEEVGTAFYLRQISERLGQSLHHALKPFNENPSGYRVLLALSRRTPLTTQELRGDTMLIPSTMSRTLEKLKANEFVTIRTLEADARAQEIDLTDKGREHLKRIFPAAASQFQWAIREISDEDLENLERILLKMLENIICSPIK